MTNPKRRSFRFLYTALNRKTIRLLEEAGVPFTVDESDVIHYSARDEEIIENELICLVRNEVFPRWAIISCPKNWIVRYKKYMHDHDIPYQGELINRHLCFLLPSKYNPHRWKFQDSESCV